jgi:site-specific DNA-methyltransferase (adenine-specific)
MPEKLAERAIKISSNENDVILDPFLGSGTTLVACEKLNRNGLGIEISKEYCKLSYQRLQKEVNQLKFGREKSKIEKIGF